jgi:hypothetical protein
MLRICLLFFLILGTRIAADESHVALICSLETYFQPDSGDQGEANGEHKLILQIEFGEISGFSLPIRCDGPHARTDVFEDRLEWGCILQQGEYVSTFFGTIDRHTKNYVYEARTGAKGPHRHQVYYGVCELLERAF